MKRHLPLIFAVLASCLLAGCTVIPTTPSKPDGVVAADSTSGGDAPNRGRYGPDVIHLDGLRDIAFGDTEAQLTRRGALLPQDAPCGPRLTGMSTVSPVFADDRLVLLWVDPPVQTPEGITIGTPVEQALRTHPDAMRLDAPHGSYRFDGLLAIEGDRAYLFLHDGRTVRKTIVGYAKYARRLFHDGFGSC
jgi:hypothetical protein